jgi:holo-[acyl-carrier protein] synthase
MIIGIGTDIVNIARIETIYTKYGNLFKEKILSSIELRNINILKNDKHAAFLAKRFAAKEALAKAFGIGIGSILQFKKINILNNEFGKPYVYFDYQDFDILDLNIYQIDISISDDYPIAVAFVIISSRSH